MLLTIHNLPTRIQYSDVKDLIVNKCGLREVILDNLQNEGSGMRVTVGVGEEEDAAILVRKINGIYFRGQQLYVEDKRQKKDSEQPYRTPTARAQQAQYQVQQPQQGYEYDYTAQMQSMGMLNFAMFQPQGTGMETVQNSYVAYGGHQAQPQSLMTQFGQLGEYNQQPNGYSAEPALFARRSPSPDRNRRGNGSRWDASDDRARVSSPDRSGPFWAPRGRDESPRQPDYQDHRGTRNERPSRTRGFNKPQDRFENRGPRQQESRSGHAPFASESARGGRGGYSPSRGEYGRRSPARDERGRRSPARGGHFSSPRGGGHFDSTRGGAGNHSGSTRGGGHFDSTSGGAGGQFGSTRGGGRFDSSRGGAGGHFGSTRGGGHFDSTRGGGHIGSSRGGGHMNSTRGGAGGHFGSTRGGGHIDSTRGGAGGHFSSTRGGSTRGGNTRGGYALDDRSRAGYPQKRRWDEPDHNERKPERQDSWRDSPSSQRQPRPPRDEPRQPRDEPRPKRFAANPSRFEPDNRRIHEQKPDTVPPTTSNKILKASVIKGVGKLIFDIANTLNITNELAGPNPVKSLLRKLLISRVNDIVGGQVLSPDDISVRYRAIYPESDNPIIYDQILKTISGKSAFRNMKEEPAKTKKPIEPWQGKIPNYPDGDKKLHIKQKQEGKKDMETLEAYQVNETFQKAMDEEIDLIGTGVFEKAFSRHRNSIEKQIFESVEKECISQCKKLLIHHLSKRITNGGVKLIRIDGTPKPPRRSELEEFLLKYSCLSLKKSIKSPYYTATFDSYDAIDELVAIGQVLVGDALLSFKQMNTGPKIKLDQNIAKVVRQKYIDSLINKDSKVNLLSKDWKIHDEEEKKAKADNGKAKPENGKATESDDVIYVGGVNVNEYTVDITDEDDVVKEQTATRKEKVSAEATEDKHDFLDGDFKVIDEVRESDNDEGGNDANNDEVVADDWADNGEDWDNVDEVNDDEVTDDTAGHDDNNADEDSNDVAEITNDDEDEDDGEDIGEFNTDDVDLDDIDEDDLEDY